MGFTVYEGDMMMRSPKAFLLPPMRAKKISSAHMCPDQGSGEGGGVFTEHPLTKLLVAAV